MDGLADGRDARRGGVGAGAAVAEEEVGGLAEVVGDNEVTDPADGDPEREAGAAASMTFQKSRCWRRISG